MVSVKIVLFELACAIPVAGVDVVTVGDNTLLTGSRGIKAGKEIPSVAGGVAGNRRSHWAVFNIGLHGGSRCIIDDLHVGGHHISLHSLGLGKCVVHRSIGSSRLQEINIGVPSKGSVTIINNGDRGKLCVKTVGSGDINRAFVSNCKLRGSQAEIDGGISAEGVE